MSRPYRILIQDIIKKQVEASDYSTLHLELLPILPEKQMKLLLSETLEEDGWEKTEEGYTYSSNEGETISINLNTLEIKVELELSATVIKNISAQIDIDDCETQKYQQSKNLGIPQAEMPIPYPNRTDHNLLFVVQPRPRNPEHYCLY